LALEARELAFHFADDVLETAEIGFGGLQPKLGLVTALVQAGNAGGLFQDGAAVERLGADQHADLALAHESGRGRARGGVGEEQLDVALAHVAAVDAVDRTGLALDLARDLDRFIFVVGRVGAAVGIVDEQRHFGDVARRASGAAGEDDVVHLRAAHRGRPRLAHHPAQRVEQVRLAAAVRADDRRQPRLDEQLRRLDEGLEAGKSEPGEFQWTRAALRC